MPQADLATAPGKSRGWVAKMELGLIEPDRVGPLNQVAAELHVHPDDLIGRPYGSSPADSQWQIAASSILRELRRVRHRAWPLRNGQRSKALRRGSSLNPFGPPAQDNRDSSWSASFTGGFITYVVSNRHVVINVIDLVAI